MASKFRLRCGETTLANEQKHAEVETWCIIHHFCFITKTLISEKYTVWSKPIQDWTLDK